MGNFSLRRTRANEKVQSVGTSEDAEYPEASKNANISMGNEEEIE